MNDDRIISLIWIIGALVLVSGALVHRAPGRRGLKLGLLWAGIILIAWGAAAIFERLQPRCHFT